MSDRYCTAATVAPAGLGDACFVHEQRWLQPLKTYVMGPPRCSDQLHPGGGLVFLSIVAASARNSCYRVHGRQSNEWRVAITTRKLLALRFHVLNVVLLIVGSSLVKHLVDAPFF